MKDLILKKIDEKIAQGHSVKMPTRNQNTETFTLDGLEISKTYVPEEFNQGYYLYRLKIKDDAIF